MIGALPSWWEVDERRLPHPAGDPSGLGGFGYDDPCPLCDLVRWLWSRKSGKAGARPGADPLGLDRVVAGVRLGVESDERVVTLIAAHPPLESGEVLSFIGTYTGRRAIEALSCRYLLDLLDLVGLDAPVGVGGVLPDVFHSHNRLVVSRGQLATRHAGAEDEDDASSYLARSVSQDAKALRDLLAGDGREAGAFQRDGILRRHSEQVVVSFGGEDVLELTGRGARAALASFGLQAHWTVLYAQAGGEGVDRRMLQRLQRLTLDGSGWLVETCPAMTCLQWGIGWPGSQAGERVPQSVDGALSEVLKGFPEAGSSGGAPCRVPDHHDSAVAALTAVAAKVGLTLVPRARDDLAARLEGWIHFPVPSTVRREDEASRIVRNGEVLQDARRWAQLRGELLDAVRISLSTWEAQRVPLL